MIGILDSGVGGLSVWKELVNILPEENYIYVADSGFCPYGPRPKEEIIDRTSKISSFLINKGAKLIVVACNTATAGAIDYLRQNFDCPFIGMEPALKPAALNSKTGVVGVLATKGTFKGELYLRTLHKFATDATVIEQVGNGLVEIVESGEIESKEARELLNKYINPMLEKNADHLVLGCTHYPFLIEQIREIVGKRMEIINPAPAVAKHTLDVLKEKGLIVDRAKNEYSGSEFYSTSNNLTLIESMVKNILGESVDYSQKYSFLTL